MSDHHRQHRRMPPSFLIGATALAMLAFGESAHAQHVGSTQPSAPTCQRLLVDAAAALDAEQYPTMLTLGLERQHRCPGPESLFLLGVAKANMLHHGLVARDDEALVRTQAIHALRAALAGDALPEEWLKTAHLWLDELEQVAASVQALEREQAASRVTSSAPSAPRAAPPFEADPSYLGPLLLGGVGAGMLGAALVTAILASTRSSDLSRVNRIAPDPSKLPPETQKQILDRQGDVSTLHVATTVLLVAGASALAGSLLWYVFTPRPSEPTLSAHVDRHTVGATLRVDF